MVSWSALHTQNIPFNCNNTIKDKTKIRKAPIDGGKDVQACKARINDG